MLEVVEVYLQFKPAASRVGKSESIEIQKYMCYTSIVREQKQSTSYTTKVWREELGHHSQFLPYAWPIYLCQTWTIFFEQALEQFRMSNGDEKTTLTHSM
jgi:hypothetical protein